jgi:hypothetical protein
MGLLLGRFQAVDPRHDPVQALDLLLAAADDLGHLRYRRFGLVGQGVPAPREGIVSSHPLKLGSRERCRSEQIMALMRAGFYL